MPAYTFARFLGGKWESAERATLLPALAHGHVAFPQWLLRRFPLGAAFCDVTVVLAITRALHFAPLRARGEEAEGRGRMRLAGRRHRLKIEHPFQAGVLPFRESRSLSTSVFLLRVRELYLSFQQSPSCRVAEHYVLPLRPFFACCDLFRKKR